MLGNTSDVLSLRGLPANIQLDVDGDRETERIYSLYSTYMSKLVKMQGERETTHMIRHVGIHA